MTRFLILSLLCHVPFVLAQKSAPVVDAAVELKKQADEAFRAKQYESAIALYQKTYDTTKDSALLFNLGRSHEALAHFPEALNFFERFKAEAPAVTLAKVPGLDGLIASTKFKIHTITIEVNETEAEVFLGDVRLGTTPLAPGLKFNAQPRVLEVKKPGFGSYKKELAFSGGMTSREVVVLETLSTDAKLLVQTVPSLAHVTLDGELRGDTPYEATLPPGTHKLISKLDGYDDLETEVVLLPRARVALELNLKKTPALYERWYFWVGIGVAVAGGTAAAIAATTERTSTNSGSLDPGRQPAGQP
jgi:tetratricopeptide (TPR) repeat protein